MLGSVLGTIFTSLTSSGTMLTGFFTEMNGSTLAYGVLSAIPFLAAAVQIPAAILVSRSGARRKYRIRFGIIARIMWILIGLIPLYIPMSAGWLRITALCVLRGLSAAYEAFPEVTYGSWLADLVPRSIRGRWLSIRDVLCSIVGIAIGLLSAAMMDVMPGLTGYMVILVLGGCIGIGDMLCYLKVEDVPMPSDAVANPWKIAKQLFRDKPYFLFMIFWAIWLFTAYMANPYTNYYALKQIGLSIPAVTVYGQVVPSVISILVSPFWGSLIDRLGNKRVMFLSCILSALAPVILAFSTEGNGSAFFLYNLLGSAVWSVPFLVSLNMMLCNSPQRERTSYVAVFHCFTELFGSFLGVLIGGGFLELIADVLKKCQPVPSGILGDEFKLLFIFSAVLRTVSACIFIPMLRDRESDIQES